MRRNKISNKKHWC